MWLRNERGISSAMTERASAALPLLSRIFGYDGFRPGQAEIVESVAAGRDVLAIMPTGGGKSLCYQLPALMRDGLTVVVSPLIALMRDQVAQLRGNGVAAAALNSAADPDERRATERAVREGELKLLYLSPERLAAAGTAALLEEAGVSLLAVDEAHCVSQWGHDFRPEYRMIGELAARLGGVQTIALTATADEMTREDILARLFTRPPAVFLRGFDRPNIRLVMERRNDGRAQLLTFLGRHAGESGIVYCGTRRRVDETAAFLNGKGVRALPYHAGLSAEERSAHQDAFLREDGLVVVATVAFGMGVDKPDVRFVFHLDAPKTIESYYQEIGRAGRDGLAADAHTLYGGAEFRQYRMWIDESAAPEEVKRVERGKLEALAGLCEASSCRRVVLLSYFGEEASPCGNCDLCLGLVKTEDGTVLAQKALSAMARTGETFGREHLISILIGEDNEKVRARGHDRLPTFGVGRDLSRTAWRTVFRQLEAAGVAAVDKGGFASWRITGEGWEVLRGRRTVALRRVEDEGAGRGTRRRASPGAPADPSAADPAVLAELKQLRRRLAEEGNVPAYVIFADRTLVEMATALPEDEAGLASLHGIGEKKLAAFGPAFLDAIRRARDRGPAERSPSPPPGHP